MRKRMGFASASLVKARYTKLLGCEDRGVQGGLAQRYPPVERQRCDVLYCRHVARIARRAR